MPSFSELFGRPPAVTASAPGRVNLIGEHTDYNDGFMLPMPIPQRTVVELAPGGSSWVRAWSANVASAGIVPFELGTEARRGSWIDYAQGVTAALHEAGIRIEGFDLRVSSNVPLGSGVSSSAAFLVALLRGLREAFQFELDDAALAQIAWRAEVNHVGVPVGVMDQMVCSLGRPDHALLIDAQSLATSDVPLPGTCEVIVIDSGIRHQHSNGEYRTRRAECERACAGLGVASLRALTMTDVSSTAVQSLPEPLGRRVRHVVTENARVGRLADALRAGDLDTSGRLLIEGHVSLRDDYEVSTMEIDTLVEIAAAQEGVFGARLTGGGFGGSIVALAAKEQARHAAARITEAYHARTGARATTLMPVEGMTNDE
jgi:galactokinase